LNRPRLSTMLTHECNNSVQVNQENTSSSTSGAMIIEEEAIQMEKDWKVGDVVRPKAGGPDMCIAGFETDAASGERTKSAVCEWFVGNKSQTGSYQVEMLEFVRQMDDVSFSGKSGR
jgi:uncharacterized protein YodC (DUF2158 family)